MAVYDYICIEWGDGCPVDNIYYAGGFYNRLYFDEEMQPPQFEIEDEGKKADGTMLAERQVWVKKYAVDIHCSEWVATVLSTIPLHETVRIIDKDGNVYYCNGPDVTIEIGVEANKELEEGAYYPVMIVKFTFNAHQIIKTACCATLTAAECSEVEPTIDSMSEIGAGTVNIEGTAPEPMLVRLYERDWIDPITVGVGGKINDICIVSATVAYCCTNGGDIYKTSNGGTTWTRVYDGSVALNGIAFDGVDKIFAIGDAAGGDSLSLVATVGTDTFAEKVTPLNVRLNAVRAHNGNAFACGINGVVYYYDGSAGTWSDISIGTVTTLRDIEIYYEAPDYRIAVIGNNVRAYTDNTGAVWTESTLGGVDAWSIALISWTNTTTGTWVVGTNSGDIIVTTDNFANIATDAGIFANRVTGLSAATINGDRYCVGMDLQGYYRYFIGADAWGDTYKQRSQPTSNRIRLAAKGTEMHMMTALGNGNAGTTETAYSDNQSVTAASYNSGGMQFAGANNVTYQLYVETYTFTTDPCEESDVELFTT